MISLVIPCYNEEENIKLFYNRCKAVFRDEYHVQYIFIDDGSKDKSFQVIEELANNTKDNIEGIRFSRNFGKEAAMLCGITKSQGEFTCIIDADLQQDPKYVVDMVEHLKANEECDCVACFQENRKEGFVNKGFKKLFYSMINSMSKIHFEANASDFRTFRTNVKDSILQMQEYNRFSKGIFAFVGFNTHFMPYTVEKRQHGKSSWNFIKLTRYAFGGIMNFSTLPLRISTTLGILSSFASVIYFITILVEKFTKGIAISGYPTIVSLILLIGGVQLIMLGIIGEYLAKSYLESKERPHYFIKNEIKKNK